MSCRHTFDIVSLLEAPTPLGATNSDGCDAEYCHSGIWGYIRCRILYTHTYMCTGTQGADIEYFTSGFSWYSTTIHTQDAILFCRMHARSAPNRARNTHHYYCCVHARTYTHEIHRGADSCFRARSNSAPAPAGTPACVPFGYIYTCILSRLFLFFFSFALI